MRNLDREGGLYSSQVPGDYFQDAVQAGRRFLRERANWSRARMGFEPPAILLSEVNRGQTGAPQFLIECGEIFGFDRPPGFLMRA